MKIPNFCAVFLETAIPIKIPRIDASPTRTHLTLSLVSLWTKNAKATAMITPKTIKNPAKNKVAVMNFFPKNVMKSPITMNTAQKIKLLSVINYHIGAKSKVGHAYIEEALTLY